MWYNRPLVPISKFAFAAPVYRHGLLTLAGDTALLIATYLEQSLDAPDSVEYGYH